MPSTITTATVATGAGTNGYLVPANARKITAYTQASAVNFRGTSATGTEIVMGVGKENGFEFHDRNLVGATLYFSHASGATVNFVVEFGPGQ